MPKLLTILLFALVMEAVGVVFLSKGLKQVGEPAKVNVSEIVALLKRGATNQNLLLGIAFETVFFICLLFMLSRHDVSLIWPLTALGFVITTLAAKWVLKEEVSALRWAGVALIVCGAGLVTLSEKLKEKQKQTEGPTAVEKTIP